MDFKKTFKSDKVKQKSYYLANLSDEDRTEFTKIADNYSNLLNTRSAIPTDVEILKIHSNIVDKKFGDKYFETMNEEKLKKLFEERIDGLLTCSQQENKTPELQTFYKEEYEREKAKFNELKKAKSFDLPAYVDTIIWSEKEYYSDFSESSITKIYDEIMEQPDAQRKINRLATFLPLYLFDYPSKALESLEPLEPLEPSDLTLNKERFIDFIVDAGKNKKNIQQFLLGSSNDLNTNFFKEKDYYQLYSILTFIDDMKTTCHSLVDYTIALNLLFMYSNSISKSKIFPIMFSLKKNQEHMTKKLKAIILGQPLLIHLMLYLIKIVIF